MMSHLQAQKSITLEDIFKKGTFRKDGNAGFRFLEDGKHYLTKKGSRLIQSDITTGQADDTLFDASNFKSVAGFENGFESYQFSNGEQNILFQTASEAIYRHSSKSKYFVFDRQNNKMQELYPAAKQLLAQFSPAADQVAFVADNNLFVKNLATESVSQITSDGKFNEIINGSTDWVYEEEFGFTQAFEWSPDSKKISYLRFDESEVPQFFLEYYMGEAYPEPYRFKYPKVGEKNAIVTAWIYNITDSKKIEVKMGSEPEWYIPRLYWTQDPNKAIFYYMNRHQDDLKVFMTDASTGSSSILLEETSKWYVDIHDNLEFLPDGKRFIWTSEKGGFNQVYLYGMDGKLIRPLTNGNYEVTKLYGVDSKNQKLYFQAASKNPMEREIFEAGLDGKKLKMLGTEAGTNDATFSPTFDYWVSTFTKVNDPGRSEVYKRSGEMIRSLYDNKQLKSTMKEFAVQPVEFFKFSISDSISLNGWMIKPAQMKPGKSNPVLMFLYGGPGSQQVKDAYMGSNYWWYEMLTQKGYIVACVDNRGTGARGEWFKKMTYLQLGRYETEDQIAAAKYIGKLPFVDAGRIGIFGWSYGGYMSSLCILKGNDVFKAAIAVAPVTNWKWYDSIYTERFMRSYEENKTGYDENSPIHFADRLKGNYLLMHGMADDNVHFQNTVEMANALIEANKQFDTYFYPNQSHGIYGGNSHFHLYTKMTQFVEDKL
ncbi:MAG: S9 family peptidase [Saprospiraceae bacterium]